MLPRYIKKSYYKICGPLMFINAWIYKLFFSPGKYKKNVYVHLGPGQRNYLKGWINVDSNFITAKVDVWANISVNLPFKSNSVDAFYSHHVIEHLPNLYAHFKEVFRCLKPNGIYRVGGPNGDNAIKKFIQKDLDWFSDFPDRRKSIGGKFENMIFCRGEHLTILTFSMLEEILIEVGFVNISEKLTTKETSNRLIFSNCLNLEHESCMEVPHTLIIEAVKP